MVDREPSMSDGEHVTEDGDENSRAMGPGAMSAETEDLREELQGQLASVNHLRQNLQERAEEALEEERGLVRTTGIGGKAPSLGDRKATDVDADRASVTSKRDLVPAVWYQQDAKEDGGADHREPAEGVR